MAGASLKTSTADKGASAFRRALVDTYQHWRGSIVVGILLGLAENATEVLLPAMPGVLQRIAALIASIAAVISAVFVWNLLRAPYRQRDEARELARERRQELNRFTDRSLALSLTELEPKQPASWGGMHRCGFRVRNDGLSRGRFYAKALAPIKGINETDYGPFFLQWDLESAAEVTIHPGSSHNLHVLRTKDRLIQFLGPQTPYGKQTAYMGVKLEALPSTTA